METSMVVYRLEYRETGNGPFTSGSWVPSHWLDSHYPPMEECSPCYEEYMEWIELVDPGRWSLPPRYRFAFSTLMELKRCFKGYEKCPELQLMECRIDTSDPLSYISLSDGQVIFSKVISKRIVIL